MKRIVTILAVAIVAVSSVCGTCATPLLMPTSENNLQNADCSNFTNVKSENVLSYDDEWTIEFCNTTNDNSKNIESDSEISEVVEIPEESFNNGEWTITI